MCNDDHKTPSNKSSSEMLDDETIVALLLDDVSVAEQAVLAQKTAADKKLRERFSAMAECLGVGVPDWVTDGRARASDKVRASKNAELDPIDSADPPAGLADRTADTLRSESTIIGSNGTSGTPCRLSLIDAGALMIAAGLVLALVSPALFESRESARLIACQHKLEEIGQALLMYSEEPRGRFPEIDPTDPAGLYAVRLADSGKIPAETLSRLVVCPASNLSEPIAAGRLVIPTPTLAEIDLMPRVVYQRLKHFIGGSYAYALPYIQNNRLHPITSHGDCRTPILGDAPAGRCQTASVHAGGQNVLFRDGGLRFVVGPWKPGTPDRLFRNADDRVAAGSSKEDAVLARSGQSPGVSPAIARRTPLTHAPVAPQ